MSKFRIWMCVRLDKQLDKVDEGIQKMNRLKKDIATRLTRNLEQLDETETLLFAEKRGYLGEEGEKNLEKRINKRGDTMCSTKSPKPKPKRR